MTDTDRGVASLRVRAEGAVPERVEGQHSGHYRLGRELATGRYGPVLEACREPGSRWMVAWARAYPGDSAERRLDAELTFLRAASIRASVRHANLARVRDYGTDGVRGFLVTDPPPQRTLDEVLAAGPLDTGVVARIGVAVAAGLAALHEAGLAHGSVAAGRIALVPARGSQVPCLLDDGLEPADARSIALDLGMVADLLETMAGRGRLPLVIEDLIGRLRMSSASALDAVRTLRAWIDDAPEPDPSEGPPTLDRAPVEAVSGWWWVFGSAGVALLSLVAVGLGGVGITQSLIGGGPVEATSVRAFPAEGVVPAEVRVDGVGLTLDEARRTLAFVNQAEPADLSAAGLSRSVVSRIVEERPFATLESFGATRGIGVRSVRAAIEAASP
ncbi:MAG: hypothetical protein AAF602_21065 [Myxococcota bacterium]